jgi:hypothetical protein
MGAKTDRNVRDQLMAIPANEERLLLATGRYIGDGFEQHKMAERAGFEPGSPPGWMRFPRFCDQKVTKRNVKFFGALWISASD